LLSGTSLLAAPAAVDGKATVSPAERIQTALQQPLSIEITDQPLTLALNQLRDQTKLNFVLDQQTLMQMNMDPDQLKVQVKLKDTKLKTGLRTILGSFNLNYAIIGETIFISTDDLTTYRQMQQRVSVDLEKVEFAKALRKLGRETATNLVIDNRVAKEANQVVTLQAEDVPLETAVRLMCEMSGLKPVRVGNVLFVTTKANAQEMRADTDLVPNRPALPGPDGNGANAGFIVGPGGAIGIVAPGARAAAPVPPPPMNVVPPPAEKTEKADPAPAETPPKEKDKDKVKPSVEPPAKPS
jgi:hypothetical protein